MKTYTIPLMTVLLLIGTISCNKTKSVSKKFLKAGEWKITELSVDGLNEEELPTWEIEDCDIYESSCFGEWKNEEGGHAEFVWQFREKAKTFELSYQAEEEEGHEHDHAAEEAAEQAYNFSGVYEVLESSKKEMEFISTTTLGFDGQEVKIKLENLN